MGDFIFCLIAVLVLLIGIFLVLGLAFDEYFNEEKMMKLAAGTFIFVLAIFAIIFLVAGIGSLFS